MYSTSCLHKYVLLLLVTVVTWTTAQTAVSQGMTADSHCGDGYCVTAFYSPSTKQVNYTLVVPQGGRQIGWFSVGQGTNMAGANMAINWVNADQTLTTSHRSAAGHSMPTENQVSVKSFSVNSNVSTTRDGLTIWSWNWPLQSGSASSQPHIFASSGNTPSSSESSARITKHSVQETDINLDLSKPYNGSAPAGLPGAKSSVGSSPTASGGQTSQGGATKAARNLNTKIVRIYFVHMLFMVIGWMLFFPLGIFIARFGRTTFKWLPAHRGVQLFGFVLVLIAFLLAVSGTAIRSGTHFDSLHEKLGLALMILLFVQALLGFLSHSVRSRTGKRYVGFVHIPFGLTIFGLSVWQIHEGFSIWKWKPPAAARYFIYAWAGFCALVYILGMFLIPRELRHNRGEDEKHSSDKFHSSSQEAVLDEQHRSY